MVAKILPVTRAKLEEIADQYGTPFHLYDEDGIRRSAMRMEYAFKDIRGFMNFFAVKALPNPHILRIVREELMGADCSSIPEIHLAQMAGFRPENIMFTSNNTSDEAFHEAYFSGARINLDDITFIEDLHRVMGGLPETLCFRYNPGAEREGNPIIGDPSDAKYGLTRPQIFEALQKSRRLGITKFGLHTMVASNERDPDYFVETARMMFNLAASLKKELGIELDFINLGGGIGIPYRPEDKEVDLNWIAEGIRREYEAKLASNELHPKIFMECGRLITGPHGYLITRVRHVMEKHRKFIGVDSPMTALLRAGIYSSAYHHVTVPAREHLPSAGKFDVVAGLCENLKFAKDRELPEVQRGDLLVIHDTGAHGHAMGNNYNGELRPKEVLLKRDGSTLLIRAAETEEDLLRTLRNFRE